MAKIILGLLILTSLWYLTRQTNSSQSSNSQLDLQVPQFSLPVVRTASGQEYDPADSSISIGSITRKDLLGHMTLINFWASWCEVCASEVPLLKELFRDYGDAIKFIGIASNDTFKDLKQSGKMSSLSYVLALDQDGSVASSFQVGSLPETFIVAADGVIVKRYSGALNYKALEEISQILMKLR